MAQDRTLAGSSDPQGWAVGIDVGGTFTDAVAVHADGRSRVAKVPTTPTDPSRGLLEAVSALVAAGVEAGKIRRVVHGTTIATNALLTGRTARVVLCATAGFRDILGIRDGMRPDMYDLHQPRPRELVRRADRLEVRERIAGDGSVLVPLTDTEIERVVAAVRRRKPEVVAVALLFGYLEPAHEARLGAALRTALPGVPVTLASDVAREFREYPRTATTVVAAALRPVVGDYLRRAAEGLAGLGVLAPLLVMESTGGLLPGARAALEPHRLTLSGPAGGVGGAIELAGRLGIHEFLTLDMGGTSVDTCLVQEDAASRVNVQHVLGAPLLVPALDIVSAGSGGGSIARLDAAGGLFVGPDSAGADPGPASYGRGGRAPTVTDAHVVVGTLAPTTLLAGSLSLDPARARAALEPLAAALGMDVVSAAHGIVELTTAGLAAALRRVSVERGADPRGLPIVAFGGAGPLHAGSLLRELGLGEVIVPPAPGLLSASGMVAADIRLEAAQTVLIRLDVARPATLARWFVAQAARLGRQLLADGVKAGRHEFEANVDCRYLGQGHELTVRLDGLDAAAVGRLAGAFHAVHEARYGHRAQDPVEAVTMRLSAIGRLDAYAPAVVAPGRPDGVPDRAARLASRTVRLPGHGRPRRATVWRRDLLRAGDRIVGPAIVEQLDATTLVLDRQVARVGRWAELHMREDRR